MSEVELSLGAAVGAHQEGSVQALMRQIRPEWQAKELIARVNRLIPVDLSSACQRLLNASFHDLRSKLVIAGVDIAAEAARTYKLPPINNAEDLENYSASHIVDLSYRVGLLNRAEWRRVKRAYEIRRDLEHEDAEYEADTADAFYVFHACIEAILSRDPVLLVRVTDFKDIVETPGPVVAGDELLHDFEKAPDPRQLEILKFLVSVALDGTKPDIVRENAFTAIGQLRSLIRNGLLVELGEHFATLVGRDQIDLLSARVAQQLGVMPYLRKAQRRGLFSRMFSEMSRVGARWTSHSDHGNLLRSLQEVGGLESMLPDQRDDFVKWLALCYVGEPGGYGMGQNRQVFFSNSGAPLAVDILRIHRDLSLPILTKLGETAAFSALELGSLSVRARFDSLVEKVEGPIAT